MQVVNEIAEELKGLSPAARKEAMTQILIPAARRDLGAYMWYVMHDRGNPFRPLSHQQIWIEALGDHEIRDVLFLCPPGVGKTNTISMCYIPWEIGRQSAFIRVALTTNQQRQASSISNELRDIVEFSPKYKKVFPHVKPDKSRKWTEKEWYVQRPMMGIKDPTFFGFGDKGAVIGNRINIHVLDDLNDEENTTSPTERERINNWVRRTLKSRLTDYNMTEYDDEADKWFITDTVLRARRVWVMTRWHENDLASIAESEGFTIIKMPALGYWEERCSIIVPEVNRAPLREVSAELVQPEELTPPDIHNSPLTRFADNPLEPVDSVIGYVPLNSCKENDLDGDSSKVSELDSDSQDESHYEKGLNLVNQDEEELGNLDNQTAIPLEEEVLVTRRPSNLRVQLSIIYKRDYIEGVPLSTLLAQNIRPGEFCDLAEDPDSDRLVLRENLHHGEQALINHGSALAPTIHSREKLLEIQTKDPLGFSRMFQQQPAMSEGEIFRQKYWGWYDAPPDDIIMWIQSYDTATSKKQRADYTCGITACLSASGHVYLTHGFCERLSAPEIEDRIKLDYRLINKFQRHEILVEKKHAGIGLVQNLQSRTLLPVVGVTPTSDKIARANSVVGLVASGRVLLPRDGGAWVDWFIRQLSDFPSAEHDDWVDAFTQLIHRLVELDVDAMNSSLTQKPTDVSYARELDAPISWGALGENNEDPDLPEFAIISW